MKWNPQYSKKEKISSLAEDYKRIQLSPAALEEYLSVPGINYIQFMAGYKHGATGASLLNQSKSYNRGFAFGARFCSKCEMDIVFESHLSLVYQDQNHCFARVCSICKEQGD